MGRLPHRSGRATRYRHVLYQSQKAEPVDVIVYRERGFEQPWFLLVPPDSESWLPTPEVVRLYRQRMQIEHCFRDWKSHLGLRGLHLQVDKSRRLLRLLIGSCLGRNYFRAQENVRGEQPPHRACTRRWCSDLRQL